MNAPARSARPNRQSRRHCSGCIRSGLAAILLLVVGVLMGSHSLPYGEGVYAAQEEAGHKNSAIQ